MKSGSHKKNHHKRASGGKMESPMEGDREWEEDLKDKPMDYTAKSKVAGEAEERKRGGRAKKKSVKMEGMAKHHAGRKPRKSGGRTGSDHNPMSSAKSGEGPRDHKVVEID